MAPRRKVEKLPRRRLVTFSSFGRSIFFSACSSAALKPCCPLTSPDDEKFVHQGPSKSKREESSDDDDDDDDEEELETIQADFGFFDPKPEDFHGVRALLNTYLDKKPWAVGDFVDLILEQTTVGTVIRLDGEDEDKEEEDDANDDEIGVLGVITVLNLGRYENHKCIGEVKKFLLGKCSDESVKKKLRLLLEDQAGYVGLLVSQRFVNCPYELVLPLYEALLDEVSWATEDEPTQELRDSFSFKYYLFLTRIYVNENINQRKRRQSHDSDEPIIYIKEEERIFHELCLWSFTFPLDAMLATPPELKNYRVMGLVMVVKAEDIPKFRKKLKALLA